MSDESAELRTKELVHDFRNILNSIQMCSAMALMDLPADSAAAEMFREIQAASTQGGTLCGQMLDGNQPTADDLQGHDLSAIAREMTSMFHHSLPGTVTLDCSLAADMPLVAMSASRLRQILTNLVTNAAQSLGTHSGSVQIRTGWSERGDCGPFATADDDQSRIQNQVYLEVSDTGCGMDEATKNRVFDPHFTTKATGHGLGMASVSRIVAENGGTIHIDSRVGIGTSILVTFPCGACPTSREDRLPHRTRIARMLSPVRSVVIADCGVVCVNEA
ncbi:ATP-binding protein [Planctomicrobium piriforme]|uniref:histidine kinase n=1 Tax=Planctomicrobium piriforme TaxID=1576369 RepID=A0A1I3PUZ5_9PLAN|nr:ATP-binding protein [Planctomicrobium piriforme]SFJ25289.1 Histidine kinase-, DNA gyrase B-, and HSP90-like ATPase [Planctomicrobium piriforme]